MKNRQIWITLFCFMLSNGLCRAQSVSGADSLSQVFKVWINGREINTIRYKDIHYGCFLQTGKVEVKVAVAWPVRQFTLSPRSRNIKASLKNKTVAFQTQHPGYLVLTINKQERLFLFADVPQLKPGGPQRTLASFGLVPNDTSVNTAGLQRAIDQTAQQGQTLIIPSGFYRSGALYIPSHARIFFESGAILKASNDIADFEDAGHQRARGFINILNASDVRIHGYGIVDGNGRALRDKYADRARVRLVFVQGCEHVAVEDIIQRDPGSWNTQIRYSSQVKFQHVKQLNDADLPNTDGFDPDASSFVTIQNCFGYCGDDNVAIKITEDKGPSDSVSNITIKGCVFLTRKSSLKVGTESRGRIMKNILFEDNDVIQSDRGMALYCSDGAVYDNIVFFNNRFEECYPDAKQMGIHFVVNKRNTGSKEGVMSHISISNCKFYRPFPRRSEISGLDTSHQISVEVGAVTIAGVSISLQDFKTSFAQIKILK